MFPSFRGHPFCAFSIAVIHDDVIALLAQQRIILSHARNPALLRGGYCVTLFVLARHVDLLPVGVKGDAAETRDRRRSGPKEMFRCCTRRQ